MQRVNSGVFQNIILTAQKPPKAPSNSRSSQMDTAGRRDLGFDKELEKEAKRRWNPRSEQAVHLVPVVLIVCLFILYISSSHVTDEQLREMYHNAGVQLPHRRLQAVESTAEEVKDPSSMVQTEEGKDPSGKVQTEVRVTQLDLLHRHYLRPRGGERHG